MANKQLGFKRYETTDALNAAKSTFTAGDIVFNKQARIIYIVTDNAATLEPYYGNNAIADVSVQNATITVTLSDGTTKSWTINNVANAGSATSATNDGDGNNISTTYLKLTGGTVTGNAIFKSSITADSINTEDLIVNGAAMFVYGLTGDLIGNVIGNLKGNADTATSASSAGNATNDGSGNNIANTYLKKTGGTISQSGWANQLTINRTDTGGWGPSVAFATNGTISGAIGMGTTFTDVFVGDGSTKYQIIHAGNIGFQSVNYASSAGSASLASTATTAGTCTGNAATATTLQTSRTIWGQSFNGNDNVDGAFTMNGTTMTLNTTATCGLTMESSHRESSISYHPNNGTYRSVLGAYDDRFFLWNSVIGEHVSVKSNTGNVGIGTTSPSYTLHVNGSFYSSSDAIFGNNVNVTHRTSSETFVVNNGCTLQYDSGQRALKFVFA